MLFLNTACENSAFLQAIYIVKEIMNVAFLLIPEFDSFNLKIFSRYYKI